MLNLNIHSHSIKATLCPASSPISFIRSPSNECSSSNCCYNGKTSPHHSNFVAVKNGPYFGAAIEAKLGSKILKSILVAIKISIQ